MKKYLDKGLSQLGKANAFFAHRGDEAEVPLDISNLPPEDAVVQLQNQNKAVLAKNRQLKATSDKYFEENSLLKQQIVDLRTYVKEVEQERASIQDRFHRTQTQHKQSLEQLQQECDNLATQMKDSQGENHALQGEVTDLRFKLMVGGSEAAGVPEKTLQEWQAQKERMQEQLQAAQEKYQEMLRREQAAKETASGQRGTDLDMAKLRAVEAELEDSKSQVSQLTERCEDLQKQVESLQTETPGLTAETTATSSGAQQQPGFAWSETNPAEGDGWGDVDGSFGAWDDDHTDQPQQSAALSGSKAQGGQMHGMSVGSVQVEASAVASALRALLEQGRASGVAPVVVTDVIALLAEYNVATCSINNTNEGCVDPFSMLSGDEPGRKDTSNAIADSGVSEAERLQPSEEEGAALTESSAAKQLSIALSPVHTNVPSVCSDAQGVKGASTESHLSPGTAELFDAAGIVASGSDTPLNTVVDATTSKLQVPLIAWENFSAAELGRYLQILSAVTCAVSNDCKASSHLLQAHSSIGENSAEPSTTASLQARVRVAEDALVNLCSEVAQAQMYATRSSQRSTLSATAGPNGVPVRRLSGDMAAAPDTPVSDVGSPAVPSMTTLNKILDELLSEHQALLQCSKGTNSTARKHRSTLQKLAKDAEAELHRLQALQSQQQDEVSIQWTEKQQLQSAAQHEIATARQELAVRQQENEMLRAQLEELESAHEQITCERDELHQQVETHSQMLASPAALQNLATVQMMPRLDLGSDSTLTPHSNHQSTPTPNARGVEGDAADGSDVGGAQTPTEELSETPRDGAGNANGEARPRPEIPPLVSESNAAATLHQAHRLGIDLRAARAQCEAATRNAQEANQRAEMLQGQLADVTAERDDLLAGIDKIEEVASARIQQDEEVAERLMIAEGQLEERVEELQAARVHCTAQEQQLVELRTAMSELKDCVEIARQRALQQEAELEELKARACTTSLSNNGTAAVSASDTPVNSGGCKGSEAAGALDAVELEGCEAVSGKDEQEADTLRIELEEATAAAAAAQVKHDEVAKLLETVKQSLEDAEARCEAHQQEAAAVCQQLASMEQSIKELEAELSSVKEELITTKDDLEASRDENSLLQEAMEGAQRKLEDLEKTAAESREKLEAAEETSAQLRQEKTIAEEQLQEATAGSEALQAELIRAVDASQTAETALEEQRLQHIADFEDIKAQAAEQLKSGTMELQKALKNAQAQLQAVGADKAASTEKASQQVASLTKELLAREQQLESTQSSLAELQTSTEKQVQALQSKIDSMDVAAKKEVGKLQLELENASKKIENLQKVNKEKRKELEQLHLQHGTVQSGAAAAEAKIEMVTRDLADANRRIRDLDMTVQQQEAAIQELNSLKKLLSKAPGASAEGSVTAQMEGLVAKAQTAARLTEEMKALQDSAQEGKQLRSEVSSLSTRAAEDAAATKRLQQELAQTISDLTAAQDQLQVYRLELQRVQAQAKKDRVRYDTEMSKSDGFLDSLSPNDLTQWPAPVKALVASQVASAVEDARSVLQGEVEAAVESLEGQLVSFQQQLAESKSVAAALSERLSVAQEHSQHLETELKEQEVAMQTQISDLQAQLQRASAADSIESGAEAERRSWQGKCAELTIQVSELRQKLQASRAQAMLVLKEKQDFIPIRNAIGGSQSMSSPAEACSRAASVHEMLPLSTPPEEMNSLVTAQSLPNNADHEGMTDYWKRRCTDLQKEVSLLQNDLADQMHVHELRDMADDAKAKEIQELQAVKSRSSVDVEYLKNIMIGFFEAGQLPHNEQVLVVLDRLLSFTPRDRSRIWKQQRQSDKGIVASLFGA